MARNKVLILLAIGTVLFSTFAFSVAPAVGSAAVFKEERQAPAASTEGAFAFVSEFTSGKSAPFYGWSLLGAPSGITSSVNYFGEPSLQLSKGAVAWTDKNISTGDQLVSFQFAVNAASGNGTFAITDPAGNLELAYVTVNGDNVIAGATGNGAVVKGTAPASSAYSNGWMYISGNLYNTSTNKQLSWTMQLFVDQTISVFANVNVPLGYLYGGLELSDTSGTTYFTNVIFSSYEIPIYLPGYNNMEGYGQASGLLVSLLHPITTLHANMILNDWNTPQVGILSFQINAMNYYGTTRSSCVGFFQLGIDLNPNGTISPWYVEGTNCFAHYFLSSNNPAVQSGFKTPDGTRLGLTIQDIPAEKMIVFQIIDYNMTGQDRYWNATMPYSGSEFYGTYTQMEFQPVAESHILDYHFNGSLYNMTYGSSTSDMTLLNNSYMLPFTLDAPATWSLTYYSGQEAGYSQIA